MYSYTHVTMIWSIVIVITYIITTGVVADINKAMVRLAETLEGEVDGSYADYQAEIFKQCKALAKNVQVMVHVLHSSSSPDDMALTSQDITTSYSQLVDDTCSTLATIDSADVVQRLRMTVHELGDSCIELLHSAVNIQSNPGIQPTERDLPDAARVVIEKVSHVASAVQAGAIGTKAYNEAIASINGVVGDLGMTAIFSSVDVPKEDKLGLLLNGILLGKLPGNKRVRIWKYMYIYQ